MAVHVHARLRHSSILVPTLLICFHIPQIITVSTPPIPTPSRVAQLASYVDTELFNLNTLFDVAKGMFDTDSVPGLIGEYVKMKEEDLVKEMAEDLSAMLQKQMEALRKSVDEAEKAAAEYMWNGNLAKDDVTYENSKELNQKGVELIYEDRFKKEVNANFSSVHIPVEIYDGSIEILNGLNWTAALDKQFIKNQNENPDMLWQYFGSQTGFMRTFPATAWPVNGVDLYDVRRQSWYTQGSSSPKDMMILIDTSGSTHGQSLQLMQNAVKSILDTLGENDFVNIISFAEQANFVSKCFNHTAFVQANFRNKKQLERDIDKLAALGQADFREAMRFAFEKFREFAGNESSETNIGANCNKVIMLLTDGGTDNADDIFKEYNWPNKTVRVFTYAVGPTPNPTKALRWMACANRGYFSQIPAMGAIRARVQEYIPVLSRPQVIKNKKVFEWGNIYEDYLGLGMTTTVTLPVYNRSLESSNQTILGVMAIDVTTAKLEAKTPFQKIGPTGYSFAINPNGYVVFHPNLKTSGKFMTEPPNIDLLELEVDSENKKLQELRTKMVKGETDTDTISTLFLSPDERYVSFGQAKYAYTKIEHTTFRLGLCVPIYQKQYRQFRKHATQKLEWLPHNSSDYRILIAPWEYQKNTSHDQVKTWAQLVKKWTEDQSNWNLDFVYHLYFDMKKVESSLGYLLGASLSSSNQRVGRFIMTNGGLTVVYPESAAKIFGDNPNPRQSSLYTRALHSPECVLMTDYTKGKRSNISDEAYVTIACGLYVKRIDENVPGVVVDKPAVVGEIMQHAEVMKAVNQGIKKAGEVLTCANETYLCYLVDEGGFVVATNREDHREQIGRFLGQVDPIIFSKMLDQVFFRTVQYDFQATCEVQDDTTSAGFKDFLVPSLDSLFEVLNVGWWTSKVTWAFTSFNFYSWWNSPSTQAYAEDEEIEKACVEATEQYYRKPGMRSFSGGAQCGNCTRNFTAVKLNMTDLLFIIADLWCEECEELYPPIKQAPREVSEEEEEAIICEMAENPRIRERNYTCYHSDPREDESECGCASLRVSPVAVWLMVSCAVWRWLVATR